MSGISSALMGVGIAVIGVYYRAPWWIVAIALFSAVMSSVGHIGAISKLEVEVEGLQVEIADLQSRLEEFECERASR